MKVLVLSIIFFIHFFAVVAQSVIVYDTQNSPLTDNTVRCITIDTLNNKWIGTDYGLAKIDNNGLWQTFTTANSGIPDNGIKCITIHNGSVYVGTQNGGMGIFDGVTWTVFDINNSNIPDNFVRSIAFDTLGDMWVGTIAGLAKYDGSTWTIFNMFNSNFISNNIAALFVNIQTNIVYAGTINGGLTTIANDTTVTTYTIQNSSIADNTTIGIAQDTNGIIWLAMPAAGLSAFINNNLFLNFNTVTSAIASNSLNGVMVDKYQSVWMASLDSGVLLKNGTNYAAYHTPNTALPDNGILCVARDDSGHVWAGTSVAGLVKFVPLITDVQQYFPQTYDVVLFPNPCMDVLNISMAGKCVHVKIYDMLGNLVCETHGALGIDKLNISTLDPGIYNALLYMQDKMLIKKIVKQ